MHRQLFQTFEGFAPSCNTLCNSATATPAIKLACDTGSLNYCQDQANAANASCQSYYQRALDTVNATPTSVSANPLNVVVGKTSMDYFNALSIAAKTKAINSINDNAVSPLADLINKYPSDKLDLSNRVVAACTANNFTGDGCNGKVSWVQQSIGNKVADWKTALTPLKGVDVSKWIINNKIHFFLPKFTVQLSDIEQLFISKIDLTMLSDTQNVMTIRNTTTPAIKSALDSFVTSYITAGKDKLDGSLTNSSNLYNSIIQAYINLLPETEPLKINAKAADTQNVQTCATNPMMPICISYSNVSPAYASNMFDVKKNYCINSDSANIGTAGCPEFVNTELNKALADQKLTANDINMANTQMIKYCTTTGTSDTINCKPFSSIKNSAAWLAQKTANTVIKDSSNNITDVTTVCGTAAGLDLPTCNEVCKVYPELCQQDAQVKCAIPKYRYSDTFVEKFEDCDSESQKPSDLWLLFLLLVFSAIIFNLVWKKTCKNKGTMILLMPFSKKDGTS